MTTGYLNNGKWIWRDGKAAININCCCCPCSWFEQPSDTEQYTDWEVKKGGGSFVAAVSTIELTFNGAWCPTDDWISTVGNNDLDNNEIGLDDDQGTVYTYRTKFEIFNEGALDCLQLSGLFSADNFCNAMRVNGNTVPAKPASPSYCQYGATDNWQFSDTSPTQNPRSDFVIDAASGWWVLGENTLEWDVINNSNSDTVDTSPTGIWVAFYKCVDNSINDPGCIGD